MGPEYRARTPLNSCRGGNLTRECQMVRQQWSDFTDIGTGFQPGDVCGRLWWEEWDLWD